MLEPEMYTFHPDRCGNFFSWVTQLSASLHQNEVGVHCLPALTYYAGHADHAQDRQTVVHRGGGELRSVEEAYPRVQSGFG